RVHQGVAGQLDRRADGEHQSGREGAARAPSRAAVSPMRMPRLSRTLLVVASVLLVTLFALPLWRIRLVAPQYPEGLGMSIRLNAITGLKPHDLDNINGLNHYIGMQAIEPDAIPELRIMPWIIIALAAGGIATAIIGHRRPVIAWLAAFAGLG